MKLKETVVAAMMAVAALIPAQISAENVDDKEYGGVEVSISGDVYATDAGPVIVYLEEKAEGFEMVADDAMLGAFVMLYDKGDMEFDVLFAGDYCDALIQALDSWMKKHPNAAYLARFTLSDGQFFACPLEIYVDESYIGAKVARATFSSKIEEIGSNRFNKWSTLKYLCSRLCKYPVTGLEIACDNPDGDFTVLCNLVVESEYATVTANQAINAISQASCDHDFLKYSWEVE